MHAHEHVHAHEHEDEHVHAHAHAQDYGGATVGSFRGGLALIVGLLWAGAVCAQDAGADGGTPPSAEPGASEQAADAGAAFAKDAARGATEDVPSAPAPAPGAVALVPPKVRTSVPPVYPPSHLSHAEHPTVVLKVTVLADGRVSDVQVEHSAGEDFDRAAIHAVTQWTFEPAHRGGEAIASRVGVAVHFDLPELAVVDVAAVTGAAEMVPHPHEQVVPHGEGRKPDASGFGARADVKASLRNEARGNADHRIERAVLEAAPHRDAADLLVTAPGMVVTRTEGDAVGHRLMLRGFDADHGQDIELTVDGVPINQPSHIHGQGYADLGFVIPETVSSLRVVEGVYDPQQGDFAVAGSADFELGVERRGVQLASSYGAFDTFRELALWAPHGQPDDTFAAVTFKKTRGFGQNRAATSGAAVAQGTFGTGKLKLTLHGSAYGSRALTANVVRRDDVSAGRIGFYDVYPLSTTEGQSGSSARAQLSARLRYLGTGGENAELTAFYVLNDFRLLANYTGFSQISQTEPTWAGRGDLIEQMNTTRTTGARARYRTSSYKPAAYVAATLEVGLATRVDQVEQAQNLLEAPENTTWDRRVDASISAVDVGGWVDADVALTRYVRLRGGVRVDYLSYRIDDRLQNFLPDYRRETYLVGYRRSAAGLSVGPRVVLEVEPLERLVLSAAYGEGYRSPMALLLDEGEPAPFAKVRSGDLGARVTLGAHDEVTLRATGYMTRLSRDIVFEPREGRAEPVGPSTRIGGVLHGEARLASWLLAAVSVTYVHATLNEPEAATSENPNPPFEPGQLLPYVPPWVLRLDLSGKRVLYEVADAPLEGRCGLGYTFWSRRPLPYSERAAPVSLLDAGLGLAFRMLELDASVSNLLDTRYAAMELSYPSNFDPSEAPSRIPARHIMAGAPRTWLLTLGVRL